MTLKELIDLGGYDSLFVKKLTDDRYSKVRTYELSNNTLASVVRCIRFQYHGNDVYVTLY